MAKLRLTPLRAFAIIFCSLIVLSMTYCMGLPMYGALIEMKDHADPFLVGAPSNWRTQLGIIGLGLAGDLFVVGWLYFFITWLPPKLTQAESVVYIENDVFDPAS